MGPQGVPGDDAPPLSFASGSFPVHTVDHTVPAVMFSVPITVVQNGVLLATLTGECVILDGERNAFNLAISDSFDSGTAIAAGDAKQCSMNGDYYDRVTIPFSLQTVIPVSPGTVEIFTHAQALDVLFGGSKTPRPVSIYDLMLTIVFIPSD